MAQPTKYVRQYDFANYQTSNPSDPLPAAQVEAELNEVKDTTDEIIDNLALIQRDDGALKNGIVTPDSLSTSSRALVAASGNPRGAWVTSTAYAVADVVSNSNITYICATAHTSGTFATDLAAGKWLVLSVGADAGDTAFLQRFSGTGAQTAFTLSQAFGTDEKAIEVYVAGARKDPVADYTLSGTALTFAVAPASGTNNILVLAVSTQVVAALNDAVAAKEAAEAAQTAAETAETNAETAETNAEAARDAALAAQTAAETAETNAETAETNAEAARDAALAAQAAAEAAAQNTFTTYKFTAAGGETSVSGVDGTGKTLAYTPGAIVVLRNGAELLESDYTATNGTSITGLDALVADETITVRAYGSFEVADALAKTSNLGDLPSASQARTNLGFTNPILDRTAPGAIGGTTPAAITGTTLTATSSVIAGTAGAALKQVHGEGAENNPYAYQFLARNRGPGGSDGAGIAFQVATSGEYDTLGPKAGVVYQRMAGNGRGALNFYNRATNDTAGFGSGDLVASLPNDGTFDVPGVYNETTANAENVHVTSDGSLQRSTSSERYKTDLEPVDFTHAAAVLDMQPIWYRSTCEADNPDWSWYGLSAEAVAEIEPRLVNWGYADDAYEDVTEEYERQAVGCVEETVERVEVRDGKAEVVTETRTTERPLYDRLPLYRDGEAVTDEHGDPVYFDIPRVETAKRTMRRLRADAAMVPQGVAYSRVAVLLLAQYQRDRATYLEQVAALTARIEALEGEE